MYNNIYENNFLKESCMQSHSINPRTATYLDRLKNCNTSKEAPKISNKEKKDLNDLLHRIINKKGEGKVNGSPLTNADFRDILDELHTSNDSAFHSILVDAGIKTVSKYSFYSNERAAGKIEALMSYLDKTNDIHKSNNYGFNEIQDKPKDVNPNLNINVNVETIKPISDNLSPKAKSFFNPLLKIQPIGKINSSSPIVVGDLDGSFGREVLAFIQSGCITMTGAGNIALSQLLNNEASTDLRDLKPFQSSERNSKLIDAICDGITINENMNSPLIFMGDIINDRFTCNQNSSIDLREKIVAKHKNIIYIAGNHEYSKDYADNMDLIAHGGKAYNKASKDKIDSHLKNCFKAAYFDQNSNTIYTHTPIQMLSENKYNTLFGTFSAESPEGLVEIMNKTLNSGSIDLLGQTVAIDQERILRTNNSFYQENTNGLKFNDKQIRSCHGHDGDPVLNPISPWQICANSEHNTPFACSLGSTI